MAIHGIGTDLCSTERIANVYQRHGKKFVEKILESSERPSISSEITAEFLAKKFACKEAISKALGCGIGAQLSFHDIIISRQGNNPPRVRLSKSAKERFGNVKIHLSVSDDAGFAMAFALAEVCGS